MPTPSELKNIYARQASWFRPKRNELFRKIDLLRRKKILEIGCGSGDLLSEIRRRTDGFSIGLDNDTEILRMGEGTRICADASILPFKDECFDLVVTQMFFLWCRQPRTSLKEIRRVLGADRGVLLGLAEPDYSAAIEYPCGSCRIELIKTSLRKESANLAIGRELASIMISEGFKVDCGIHNANPLSSGIWGSSSSTPMEIMECTGLQNEKLGKNTDIPFLFIPYFWFLAEKK